MKKLSSKIIRKIVPTRLWQQIFLLLVLWTIIPLVILGGLLIGTSQNAIKTSTLRDYHEIAIRAAGEVEEKIMTAQKSLVAMAAVLGSLHADPWRQETAIVELALQDPIYQRIASVGLNGREIVVSQLGTPLADRSGEEAFRRAAAGEPYRSDVFISSDHLPMMTVAVPIRQRGEVSAVLMAKLNLRGIWDIVDSIAVGRSGTAYIIDQSGRVIAHRDKKRVLKNSEPAYPQITRLVLAGQAGSIDDTGRGGKGWVAAYAPVRGLDWGLMIEQPKQEAYAFLDIMKIQSWLLIVLSVMAAIVASLILARVISGPMNELIRGTRRLAQGDFTHVFRIRRRDEVGRMFVSFNRMAHKLRKARQVEKLSVVGRAATTIAHELKNSLALIKTFIHLLPERHRDKQFIREFSETIPKELDSWHTLLQNMMELSRTTTWTMTELSVNGVVDDVVTLARLRIAEKRICCDVDLSGNLPPVMGCADKLKQAFLNLMINSVEATPSEGAVRITTRWIEASRFIGQDYIEVIFANSGETIAPENIERIFEPFFTTKADGLGLGLSVSQEIIKHHGGEIKVVPGSNRETTFVVRIPTVLRLSGAATPDHRRDVLKGGDA